MPISPERMKLYPGGSIHSPEWKQIRARILERAESLSHIIAPGEVFEQCECTGECGRDHSKDEIVYGYDVVEFFGDEDGRCQAVNGAMHPVTDSKVVLTIAHLDHNPENSDDDNLKAMCQRCHLKLDADIHRRNAQTTRHRRRALGDLFDGEEEQ